MEIDRELLKGSISLLLLNLLSRGEMYGYEILQAAAVRSDNAFEFKEGTLYPALHQFEKRGLVRSQWRTGDNGRERKYYSLTAKGRKRLTTESQRWAQLSAAVAFVMQAT